MSMEISSSSSSFTSQSLSSFISTSAISVSNFSHALSTSSSASSSSSKTSDSKMDESDKKIPDFKPLTAKQISGGETQYRRIHVPANRIKALKENWMTIYQPIVEKLLLKIRFNTKNSSVELMTSEKTASSAYIQKASDFIKAFVIGFELKDAIAILRVEDIYIDSFEVKDVKHLQGDNLSRAVGRIVGQGGKTKFTIENSTMTRIVIADTHIHILGSYQSIRDAKNALCNLILGAPPAKVFTQCRSIANRAKEKF
eukprot:TRINITY_DN2184_c0_g1_i1.p1 TRINITY_DN2184_c0_g1~~TRINITY_DN2184_c0_g1_i1.p1  ORF type:complete len:256 (+),score=57.31 TRINITY_DN2184_c0_g1_i1:156-923(+)